MQRFILIAVVLAGLAFRFYHLDYKVFWEDEIIGQVHTMGHTELEIAAASPGLSNAAAVQRYFRFTPGERYPNGTAATVAALAAEDPQHPPVYYVLCRLWVELFGTSVAAIRSLSALFGVLVLPCMYWLCLELFDSKRTAWIAVALVAISPFQVLYSQEAREFGLWGAAVLLLCVAFLRANRVRSVGAWAFYCAAIIFSMYVCPLSALVVAGQGFYLLLPREGARSRGPGVQYLVSAALGVLAFWPWLAIIRSRVATLGGGSPIVPRGMAGIMGAHMRPGAVLVTFFRNLRAPFFDFGAFHVGPFRSAPVNALLAALTLAIVGWALYYLVRTASRRTWGFVVVALLVPEAPLVVHDLVFGSQLVVQIRYFVPLYLGLEIVVAYLLSALMSADSARLRLTGQSLFGLLVFGGVLSCAVSAEATTWATKDYEQNREVAAIVNGSRGPLVVSDYRTDRALGLAYYLDPRVPMRLDLYCSECEPDGEHAVPLLGANGAYDSIFLLGPSLDLAQEASRLSRVQDGFARVSTIEVETFPEHSGALNMFRTP